MDMSLTIDAIVIVLLAATIFYAFRLERKLEGLRSAHTAFAGVVRDLNTAAARAEAGIQGLKSAAESSGEVLDDTDQAGAQCRRRAWGWCCKRPNASCKGWTVRVPSAPRRLGRRSRR